MHNRFYFSPSTDDREELFGKLKADWQGPPTQTDLELLNTRFYPPDQYVPFEELSDPIRVPIEDLVYRRPKQLGNEASAARERFFKSKRQLEEVQELLRLLDKYGYQPKGPEHLERLDSGDDREKLWESRRLAAVPIAGSKAVPMKRDRKSAPFPQAGKRRGRPPEKLDAAKAAMLNDLLMGQINADHLIGMKEKQLVGRYGHIAKRTILRDARQAAMSEFGIPTISDK